MECPKCHKIISDNATVCPHCHKVLTLVCPNCKEKGDSPVCSNCGYIILTKCSKCGRKVSTEQEKCKCGFPVVTSIAAQECESDEFASVIIKFTALKMIRRVLGSQDLYKKFYFRLRNLLTAQFKNVEGKIIAYKDSFVVNFNKELSFPTSVDKAVRFSLKVLNAFTDLNLKMIQELGTPLRINVTIVKKEAEDLLKETVIDSNVKLLNVRKDEKIYLKGMQIILDQYVWDEANKSYKTDSLYSVEKDNATIMFYEVLISNYVLPPTEKTDENTADIKPKEIKKTQSAEEDDIYSFKVFDINAKCNFKKVSTNKLLENLDDNKIISIRATKDLEILTSELINYYKSKDLRVIHTTCTEELNYKSWGVLESIYKNYYKLSVCSSLIPKEFQIPRFQALTDLVFSKPRKASTPEDARFAYMDDFSSFLASLKNTVIIIEGFEYMDDTSIQTLELYFDKFKKLNISFVFVTDSELSLHSKFKGLLRTPLYTEFVLQKSNFDSMLTSLKQDASDFIKSFYFEKIQENFNGSLLYVDNAIRYLKEKDVLIDFENKLIIKNKDSVILPNTLAGLLKSRLKALSKNQDASMILAYSLYLGAVIDIQTLEQLGVADVQKNAKILEESGFVYLEDNLIHVNNYNQLKPVLSDSLKRPVEEFLCKTVLAKLNGLDDTIILLILGKLSLFNDEYLLLWRNSQFAMNTGDYDAYLKNCLGFLSLLEHLDGDISQVDIENNKKEVYQNILMSLYAYSPAKIYSIEKMLLKNAEDTQDDEKIVKLSNLMLQGALVSANYTDALPLLHNILSRMSSPTLLIDGAINAKFLLLSLVNIEILFNIGEYAQCVDVAKDILAVLSPEIIGKIKPASFSENIFVEHIFETFRLAAFAKLLLMDDGLEELFDAIRTSIGGELPDKSAIIAIRDFLNGKSYATSNIERASAFSKVIFLILQEFSEHANDYKTFAQNIYQAKLLASDIHQYQLELFCDLLIAYSYANMGIDKKAEAIYQDVLNKAENSAIFNIATLAKYFIVRLKVSRSETEEALLLINDTLALLQKNNNQSKITFVLFEKLFIDIVQEYEITSVNIESEEQKLALATTDGKMSRIVS